MYIYRVPESHNHFCLVTSVPLIWWKSCPVMFALQFFLDYRFKGKTMCHSQGYILKAGTKISTWSDGRFGGAEWSVLCFTPEPQIGEVSPWQPTPRHSPRNAPTFVQIKDGISPATKPYFQQPWQMWLGCCIILVSLGKGGSNPSYPPVN